MTAWGRVPLAAATATALMAGGLGAQVRASSLQAPSRTGNVCDRLTEATVRQFTGVPAGIFTQQSEVVSATTNRCLYGVNHGALVLDIMHLGSESEAMAHIASLGAIATSDNDTSSPYGQDQVNHVSNYQVDVPGNSRADGLAARHGSTVVVIATTGNLSAPDKVVQGTALQLAGAQLVPWPTEDVCARVPAKAVQSLVSLGPAIAVSSQNRSKGGNSYCDYTFAPSDRPSSARVATVELYSGRFINDTEAAAKMGGTAIPLPFPTGDARDRVFAAKPGDDYVYAFHGGNVGRVSITNPGTTAANEPTSILHQQWAALVAAGATVPPSPALAPFPPAVEAPFVDRAWFQVRRWAGMLWLPGVLLLLVLWPIRNALRRRRILRTGLRGTARVLQVADTGTTVNSSPVIRMLLDVSAEDGHRFQASVRQGVSRLESPADWVGQTLEVRIDRRKLSRVVVVRQGTNTLRYQG